MLKSVKECPYYLISRVSLVVTSALKKGFADAGVEKVRPAYLCVMMSLWKENGLKVIELGKKAGLEPSTMTGLLDRMERDGLVSRTMDPRDRRVIRINLTETGRQLRDPVAGRQPRRFGLGDFRSALRQRRGDDRRRVPGQRADLVDPDPARAGTPGRSLPGAQTWPALVVPRFDQRHAPLL